MGKEANYLNKNYNNVLNYVYQYRDIPMEEYPFSILDYLIFAGMAYFPAENFEKTNEEFKPKKMQEFLIDFLSWINVDYYSKEFPAWMKKSIFLAMGLLKSKRYQDVMISHFGYAYDENEKYQFGALNFVLPDHTFVSSFRGTDNSINGWKEDFNLALTPTIPGQKLAADFLRKAMAAYPDYSFVTTGHSKGANLAVFAASVLSEEEAKRLINVYSFDGPGLSDEVFNSEGHKRIENRIIHVVPRDAAVGTILNHEKITMVVDASPKGDIVNQHDLYCWKVKGNHFQTKKRISSESAYLSKSLNEWIEKIPLDQRKFFVQSIFDVLEEAHITKADSVYYDVPSFVAKFLIYSNKLPRSERKSLSTHIGELAAIFLKNRRAFLEDKQEYKKKKKIAKSKPIKNEA